MIEFYGNRGRANQKLQSRSRSIQKRPILVREQHQTGGILLGVFAIYSLMCPSAGEQGGPRKRHPRSERPHSWYSSTTPRSLHQYVPEGAESARPKRDGRK